MKLMILATFGFATLVCGLTAAHFWRRSTQVPVEPEGFEPVVPELQQNWWKIAEWKAATQSGALNRQAAWWTAAAALLGFVTLLVGVCPSSN